LRQVDTLRLIAGLDQTDGGHSDRCAATSRPPAQRNIAMVFSPTRCSPHLTVAENIGFGLRVRKVEATDRDSACGGRGMLGLASLLERKPARLSSRAAAARGARPGDHRASAYLPHGRAAVESRRAVAAGDAPGDSRPAATLGVTMVYVTHDQVEAMSMADRVILLSGAIEQNHARRLV
jgi:sn-glycerol 3-phosphate transport system ATP-binding protein